MYPTDVMRSYSDDVQQRAQQRASRARHARELRAASRPGPAPSGARSLPEIVANDQQAMPSPGERWSVWSAIVRGFGRAAGPVSPHPSD
jgi:hypothetical protein